MSQENLTASTTCPICSSVAAGVFIAGPHKMYRCRTCATAFVAPLPDAESLEKFYSRYHMSPGEGGSYGEMEARMEADFPAKIELLRKLPLHGTPRLLDVGCGRGYFVAAAAEAGFNVMGIDISDTAVRYATEALGVRAICGDITTVAGQFEGAFDVASFWATIEHVRNPLETLRAIRRVLRPNGWLLLDTGIGDDLLDRWLPGVTQWYDPPQHLFVFSEAGMRRALDETGFSVVKMDTCFERSALRRISRQVRNLSAALLLRAVAESLRVAAPPVAFTRFALGNLMSVVAQVRS